MALHGSMRTPFGNSVLLSELLTASGGSHDPYGSTGIWKCLLKVREVFVCCFVSVIIIYLHITFYSKDLSGLEDVKKKVSSQTWRFH